MSCVFCYGTLLFPEVMLAVAGVAPAARPGVARGWARYRVRGERFPGLVAQAGATTPGAVYADVDAAALARLDEFEGPLYVRRTLEVECAGEAITAFAWVIAPGREAELTGEPWSPELLSPEEIRDFVSRRAAPRR